MNILAIDPGKSGGIAHHQNGLVRVYPMPETEQGLVELLANLFAGKDKVSTVYIEKVGGFIKGSRAPGSHMFNFGWWASGPIWIAQCFQIRIVTIQPQKWQKILSLGTGGKTSHDRKLWKAKLKTEAQHRYPGLNVTLKTADALLILDAAIQMEKGG